MKAPNKVKSLYQVKIYTGFNPHKINYSVNFNSYGKAKKRFEEEVTRANGNYWVELLALFEMQGIESAIKTKIFFFTLANNL